VLDGVALVYDSGDTLYVAKPTDPKALGRDDIVVVERSGGQLCHNDVIRRRRSHGWVLSGRRVPEQVRAVQEQR